MCIVHVQCVIQCACGRTVSKIFQPDPVITVHVVLIMALKCLSAVESENYLSYIFIIKMHRDAFLQLPSSILEHSGDCIYLDGTPYARAAYALAQTLPSA